MKATDKVRPFSFSLDYSTGRRDVILPKVIKAFGTERGADRTRVVHIFEELAEVNLLKHPCKDTQDHVVS